MQSLIFDFGDGFGCVITRSNIFVDYIRIAVILNRLMYIDLINDKKRMYSDVRICEADLIKDRKFGRWIRQQNSNMAVEGSQKLKMATPPKAGSKNKCDSHGGRG